MPVQDNFVKKIGRVLYADPNAAFGSINGVPMTPDYSDFCISFKLECRILPRFKQNTAVAETDVTVENKDTKKNETVKYSINWNTPYGTIGENQWVSFMQGELYNGDRDSSLTTYYTDLHYDDYKQKTIVEGLGIENVTISYETYYMPTISIKFVDHRGSALFGREEVVHYDDKITIDSIFGAFFTAPYPMFRMQVKGFYGRAVTYQMTCTGFKGSMNSQTGNFEAVATFVGYSYSLLTDIPFEYLVAAPYCKYVGEDYWLGHRDSDEWRMVGNIEGEHIPTLFEFFQNINAAFNKKELLSVISPEDKHTTDVSSAELNTMYSLSSMYDDLFEMVNQRILAKDTNKNHIIFKKQDGENDQYLYLVNESADKTWNDIKQAWDIFTNNVKIFNETYEDEAINDSILPQEPSFTSFNSRELFHIDKDKKTISLVGVKEETVEELTKLRINGVQLNEPLCEEILARIKQPDAVEQLLPRVYAVDWGTFKDFIDNAIARKKSVVAEINRKTEREYLYLAHAYLGIVPYVGNIFRLIICHIETFVHMMYQCYINISSAEMVGQRKAEYLKVSKEATDVITRGTNIPPWPYITKSNDTTNYYLMTEREDTFGWVGDFSEYFEEAKLVRALYAACKRTAGDPAKTGEVKPIEYMYAPILPNDLNDNLNPFVSGDSTLSSLGGMLGIRLAQIFGVGEANKMEDSLAQTLGRVDAVNYYRFIGDRDKISSILSQCEGSVSEALYDIMLCKDTADKYGNVDGEIAYHSFEFAKKLFNDLNRHQIFKENGDGKLTYVYMPTKSHYGIVPANARSIETYQQSIKGLREIGQYFEIEYIDNETFIHHCSADQLFVDYRTPDDKTKYINHEMYHVIIDQATLMGITNRYNDLKSNKICAMGEEYEVDMTKMLSHYWALETRDFNSHLINTLGFFSKPYSNWGIEDRLVLSRGLDSSSDVRDTVQKFFNIRKAVFNEESLISVDDNTTVNVKDLIIPEISCYPGLTESLFGVDFYYMQNVIPNEDVRNRVKALLFLHTLPYNMSEKLAWDVNTFSNSIIKRVPFGKAAFYGALLWRHDYIKNNHVDPILYGNKYKPAYVDGGVEYTLFKRSVLGNNLLMYPQTTNDYTYRVFGDSNSTNAAFVHMPDYMVANELKSIFEYFVANQWKTICDLELRKGDGKAFATGAEFREFINSLATDSQNLLNQAIEQTQETVEAAQREAQENEDSQEMTAEEVSALLSEQKRKAYMEALSSAYKKFASFGENYCFLDISINNDMLRLWLNPNNTKMQEAIKTTYIDNCIELATFSLPLTPVVQPQAYGDITLDIDNVKSYLTGFVNQMENIRDNISNDVALTAQDRQVIQDTPEFNRALALPIYMYLKALWDKWLVAMDLTNHNFMVKNFDKNFIFMDTFYRNIDCRFMMNCQILLDCYNKVAATEDTTAFKYLTDVVNEHQLMFVGLPCFESDLVSKDLCSQRKAMDAMKTIFTPLPYENLNPIDENNRFAIIYIPGLSEIPSELNGYKKDSFDIIDEDGNESKELPRILQDDFIVEDTSMYGLYFEYGYYVPAFSLAYGQQNNHIFTNLNLNMETPIITSTVINTLSNTARRGANNTHRVAFIGQDIYPVFSNYSYQCEFEMMGCAQIQPLMYFQLLNVPMWRGTYIIFSVVHTMTPGNMVTKVKAVKLSCRVVPYSNAWFTENPHFDANEWRKKECLDALASGKYGITNSTSANNSNTEPVVFDDFVPGEGYFKEINLSVSEKQKRLFGRELTRQQSTDTLEWTKRFIDPYFIPKVNGQAHNIGGFHKSLTENLQAFCDDLSKIPGFVVKDFWAVNYRNARSYTRTFNQLSMHSYGIAFDLNVVYNGYSEGSKATQTGDTSNPNVWRSYDHPVVRAAARHGFGWGGRYGDWMHFSFLNGS